MRHYDYDYDEEWDDGEYDNPDNVTLACVRCGKYVDQTEQGESFMMDLPPCCTDCHEIVSYYVAQQIPFWPIEWTGGYKWSKKLDQFVPSDDWIG